MKIGRRVTAAMAGVLAAPLIVVALPSGTAFAHGYVNSPASRQAQCATNAALNCGAIRWEPQSVEGPKGLQSCHANLSQFAELSNDNKGWKVTNTGRSVTFNWTFTARHRTRDYDYFVDGRKVATFSGNNQQPPATVSHTVNVGSAGRHKVLAVWNIGDTAMAFYSCIDINAS
ncbi:lytic polysaccharide monooxygenase auxiliary activity family 9 protein [Lentzea sp. BCCO 10_0061]|uniref:Lytic polysaccharide monooxygenase auxiliary activity family 9 protein n=1 Tax=Lentzea sokolovensis TaxID=3095429 RepID=A0ABU4VDP2_9PSEU|nr:lytic polysaccharide monooxygenase auxiliary activity family 9 protein [Lentzea sp. BCCO 10_0061]MDX8149116.1 lytic polysaccharide monooxygenase auxiliary activity family 9 protein [Lentzea sp. BCCO 10_0061]